MGTAASTAGENIRRIRQRRRWSLEELASKCGFTRMGLSKVELGQVASSVDRYQDIANALGVSLACLLAPQRSPSRTSPKQKHTLSAAPRRGPRGSATNVQ